MRASARLVVVMALALPAAAYAFDLNANAGLTFTRSDSWSSTLANGSSLLDWWLQLAMAGSPLRAGMLDWSAEGHYRGLRTFYPHGNDRTDNLGGRLQLSLLNGTPVSLSLTGSRDWSEFASSSDNHRTGATLVNTAGAVALLTLRRFPSVRAGFLWTNLDNRTLDGDTVNSNTYGLSLGVAHNIASLTYAIDYDTGWNTGSYAETNYRSHALNLQLTAPLGPHALFHLVGRYYLRDPSNDASTNPRYDDGSVGAGVQWRPTKRMTSSFDYAYRNYLITGPQSPSLGEETHAVSHSTFIRLSDTLSVEALARASYGNERRADDRLQTAGESVGFGLNWLRKSRDKRLAVGLGGGGQLGLLETSRSGVALAYGGTASASVTHTGPRLLLSASYNGSFLSGIGGQPGWTLNQQILLTADGPVRRAFLGRLTLAAIAARREDPLLGQFESTSLTLTLAALTARHQEQLSLGDIEGASSAVGNSFVGDGLFLPSSYSSHALFATFMATQTFDRRRLVLTEIARGLWTSAPGRPAQYETGIVLSASYTLGAFIFALDERFSVGGVAGGRNFGNQVMARVSRSFGWRW